MKKVSVVIIVVLMSCSFLSKEKTHIGNYGSDRVEYGLDSLNHFDGEMIIESKDTLNLFWDKGFLKEIMILKGDSL